MARGEDARDVTVDNTTGCTGCSVVADGGDGVTVPMLTSVSARARGKVSRSGMESGLRFRCWWAAGWKTVSDARCDWLASILAVLSPAEAMETVLMLTSASAWARSKVPEVAVG